MDVRCRDIVGGGAELCDCVCRDLPPPSDSDTPCIHLSIPGGSVSRVLTSEGSQPAADTTRAWAGEQSCVYLPYQVQGLGIVPQLLSSFDLV